MHHEPEPASISLHAWAWWLLGAVAVMCATVAAFNAIVDPTAQLGTGVLEPIAAGPRDRRAKVELLTRAGAAPLVVLGSSRTKKLDPAWLGADDGVNAAVVGGDLFEARVLAAWLARRALARREPFPQLVVGIDVEQFRDSSLHGSGFLDVPAIAAAARREAAGSSGSFADETARLGRLLLTMQVTRASIAAVRSRRVERHTPQRGADGADGAAAVAQFTARGVLRSDQRWFGPAARRFAAATVGRIQDGVREYRGTYDAIGTVLDPDAVADLRALLRIARDAGGPPPLLYVTPAHPTFADALASRGRTTRLAVVRTQLDKFAAADGALVIDCSACIDDATTSWIDATHPSPLGARQLATQLERVLDQAPSATPVERSGASR